LWTLRFVTQIYYLQEAVMNQIWKIRSQNSENSDKEYESLKENTAEKEKNQINHILVGMEEDYCCTKTYYTYQIKHKSN